MEISRTATDDTTTWAATIDGTEVAWLSVWTVNGEICDVSTRSTHQGQGLARALFEHASTERPIFHTIPAHRSADGDGFARAVGGDDIDEDDAVVIDCCACGHCGA